VIANKPSRHDRYTRIIVIAALALTLVGPSRASAEGDKSPKKAFLMSLVLPGWGEYYSGAKYRAAGFFGAEALTWLAWTGWRSKGADLRAEFRQFADQNWNEARYRSWQAYNASEPSNAQYIETETLPDKSEDIQQYYELIGKYAQFRYAWSDVDTLPLSVDNQSLTSSVQDQYETMRNDSNKQLKRASVVIGLAVVNHVASAIHASAYTRSRLSPESRKVWVHVAPVTPGGRSGIFAGMTARF
jgi:preprotein translocase subunit Sss1